MTDHNDDRPWEPLNGRPLRAGDEVRRDYQGISRIAVVASVDEGGYPWTAEGGFIGSLEVGTWYVRRTVQVLPTEPGTVIVPADGYDAIEVVDQPDGEKWYAKEAMLGKNGKWYGVWRRVTGGDGPAKAISAIPESITPNTWKVDDE